MSRSVFTMGRIGLMTGDSRNTGCEGVAYDTRTCCSVPIAVKLLSAIMMLISAVEIGTEVWIFFQLPWTAAGMRDMGLDNYSIVNVRLLKGVCIAAIIFGLLRTGSILYLYTSLTEPTLPRVNTARGVCICNATFNTIMLICVLAFLAPVAVDSALLSVINSELFSGILTGLLAIDVGILICFGLCVVETYRKQALEGDTVPTVRMSDWAARHNDTYKTAGADEEDL